MRKALAVLGTALLMLLVCGNTAQALPAGRWVPPSHIASWQWQLATSATAPLDMSVQADVYDVDGFDTTPAQVARLTAAGRATICYLDVGGAEDYRPDYRQFPLSAMGKTVGGWPHERWLFVGDPTVRSVMAARIAMCAAKGFKAVETDLDDGNLEGTRATGIATLTQPVEFAYLQFLADTIHSFGMAWFSKNGVDASWQALAARISDGNINEQCVEYSECDVLAPFGQAGKPVLHVEYSVSLVRTCAVDRRYANFTSMKKPVALTAPRTVCP